MNSQVEMRLEITTPLFLSGADARGDPELRPASVKGVLRYWWRALWGGAHVEASSQELAQAEGERFGNTKMASPLVLRLEGSPRRIEEWRFPDNRPGVNYLFFALRGTRREPARRGFGTGQGFTLKLEPRAGAPATQAEQGWRESCAALWLWLRLGGLGARSRRGAGSLAVTEVSGWPEELPDPVVRAGSIDALRDELAAGLQQIYEALQWAPPVPQLRAIPEYDILHPQGGPIYLLSRTWPTWEEALEAVGKAMLEFRRGRPPYAQQIKEAVTGSGNRVAAAPRADFGLPVVFYYPRARKSGTLEGETVSRRSSPLVLHPLLLANGEYAVTLVRFNSRFLPKGTGLMLKRRGRPVNVPRPDGELLTDFLRAIGSRRHQDPQGELFIAPIRSVPYPSSEEAT